MEIYIEKAFLDDLYLTVSDPPSREDRCLLDVFEIYGSVNKYVDCKIDSFKDLEELKNDNPFFSKLCVLNPPQPITSLKDQILESNKKDPKLVFCLKQETWFNTAEKNGCVCFTFNNYKDKIKKFLDSHIEMSFILVDNFEGWEILKPLTDLPNREIYLNDDYILTDISGQKIDDNLIPVFQNTLPNNCESTSHIFTEEFKAHPDTSEKRKEKAKKIYKRLIKEFDNSDYKFVIYSKKGMPTPNAVLHGRTIVANYFKIYSPKGFNLIPFKKNNEVFKVMTIFDKKTFMEINAEIKIYRDWLEKTNSDSWNSMEFTSYPSN